MVATFLNKEKLISVVCLAILSTFSFCKGIGCQNETGVFITNKFNFFQIEKSQGEIYRLRAKLESTQTENENLQDELEKMQQALNRSYSDRDKIVTDLDKLREDLERSQVRTIHRSILGHPKKERAKTRALFFLSS